jgi:hypothetical protein
MPAELGATPHPGWKSHSEFQHVPRRRCIRAGCLRGFPKPPERDHRPVRVDLEESRRLRARCLPQYLHSSSEQIGVICVISLGCAGSSAGGESGIDGAATAGNATRVGHEATDRPGCSPRQVRHGRCRTGAVCASEPLTGAKRLDGEIARAILQDCAIATAPGGPSSGARCRTDCPLVQ